MSTSVPSDIQQEVEALLGATIRSFSFSGGGCINNGGRLSTSAGEYFLKWNVRDKYPGMFLAEAKGLALLQAANALPIPAVIDIGETEEHQFLLLEYIDEKPKQKNYWEVLGEGLAMQHQQTSATFGLDHDNYIGSLPQRNTPSDDWIHFFIEHRLNAQVQCAVRSGKITSAVGKDFDTLFNKLPSILPIERPSLLHGDLWSGNLITDNKGQPCLIDPAVYFGNREAEIAFTKLFGGFSAAFYDSYNANYPLMAGHEKRRDLYNLYPLLVHVNLFGGGYVSQVVSILRAFV
jgi:protein-ribulosamine 3-kinase